jgi:N-glycosylase/DNA lyase
MTAEVEAPGFDLALTLDSGQVFHWEPDPGRPGRFVGLIGATPCAVERHGDRLAIDGPPPAEVATYFALDHPLDAIVATFPRDPAMEAATAFARGMRIIRQPRWECLATFITSALKQVPHIRAMSRAIRERWGRPVPFGGEVLRAYPSPETLAGATEAELRACGLGFRARHLLGAARALASGQVDLAAVAEAPDDAARELLCRLPGVGVKVANCALLFGFGRLAAFPIDTWIERVLREIYFKKKRRVTPARLREFAAGYFGPYGGYAQQYLFHHARSTWRRGQPPRAAVDSGPDPR